MKKILTFGASSSINSINKQLASYAASLVQNGEVHLIDMNDYEMPIYSIDREQEGIPEPAIRFKKQVKEADAIIISFAEHNGTYTAAYKNVLDWATRVEKDMWMGKPMLLLSTSPGGRGGLNILTIATTSYAYLNGRVIGSMAVPSFGDNFTESGLKDAELQRQLEEHIATLEQELKSV